MPMSLLLVPVLAALAAAAPPTPASPPASGIVFLEDDYPAALARAKAEKKLLFLDSWATWCHSCLSMRAFVFPDVGLRPAKDAVVWLAVETEAERNRLVVEKFPADGLPSFLLIDPNTEQVIGRWLGTSAVNEMRHFVLETAASWQAAQKGGKVSAAMQAEQQGHAAQQKGDHSGAAAAYRRAVALSAKDDLLRSERLALLVATLGRQGTPGAVKECVALARVELAGMPASPPGADFSIGAAECAARSKRDPKAKTLLAAALARMETMAGDATAALSVDDRSDLYANLAGQLDALGRHDEAVGAMRKRAAMLEAAAAEAPDAATAATFDAHRTETYLSLGQAPKAEALLSAREKEMPGDYNPPARLARVLLEEKRAEEAEAAVDRALARMPRGPRKVGVLGLKVRILAAQGKDTAPVLREQLALLRTLPPAQKQPGAEQRLEAELRALDAGPHAAK